MNLELLWRKYSSTSKFNLNDIPKNIQAKGVIEEYSKDSIIVTKGDYPKYILFICSGVVIGSKEFENGNKYRYFQLDKSNGSIGLLEILAKKGEYVSTITALTKVKVLKIPSNLILELVMENKNLLRKCVDLLANDLYNTSENEGRFYYLKGIDRVRHYLVKKFEESKCDILILEEKYHELASEIGMSLRTVGRSLKELREKNEICSDKRGIILTKEQYRKLKDRFF